VEVKEEFEMVNELIFITGALTIVFSLLALDARIFLAQVILSFGFFFIKETNHNVLNILVISLQVSLLLFTLYRCKKAIDFDYQLVLEKTRLAPKNLTKGGYLGGDFSLFKKPF
jgi:hypothetical protein